MYDVCLYVQIYDYYYSGWLIVYTSIVVIIISIIILCFIIRAEVMQIYRLAQGHYGGISLMNPSDPVALRAKFLEPLLQTANWCAKEDCLATAIVWPSSVMGAGALPATNDVRTCCTLNRRFYFRKLFHAVNAASLQIRFALLM